MTNVTAGHTDDEERLDGDQLVAEYLRELEREAARLPWNTRMELLEDVQSHIAVALVESDVESDAGEASDGDSADADQDATIADAATTTPAAGTRTAHVRRILAALGEPREIVDAAAADEPPPTPPTPPTMPPGFPPPPPYGAPTGQYGPPYGAPYQYPPDPGPPYPLGAQEIFAILLLLFGGLLYGIGWIIGVVLLWTSSRWNLRERLLGTLVWPGGLAALFAVVGLASVGHGKICSSSSTDGVEQCTPSGSDGFSLPGWLALPLFILGVLAPVLVAFYLARTARTRPGPDPWRRRSGGGGLVAGIVGVILFFFVGAMFFACAASGTNSKPQPVYPSSSFGVPDQNPSGGVPGAAYSSSAAAQPSPSSP